MISDDDLMRDWAPTLNSRVTPPRQLEELVAPAAVDRAKAFVTTINGRTMLTAPATIASTREPTAEDITAASMLHIHGRFVGAEVPNRNGALWTAGDLQIASSSVAHGPLNWLHEARHVIGTITQADFVSSEQAAASSEDGQPAFTQPHITASASIWKWIWPDEAFVVQQASDLGQLHYSMECISRKVTCAGENGCGNTTSYSEYMSGAGCEHVTQRASVRRFDEPVFLGGAVIVPPTRPGWAEADASVMKTVDTIAEAAFEQAGQPDITTTDFELMLAQLVRFAES